MREDVHLRVMQAAEHILETGATVRACAREFGVSKTTIHKDMREKLKLIHPGLARDVGEVLDKNRAERHLRGGMATREKYHRLRTEEEQTDAVGIRH